MLWSRFGTGFSIHLPGKFWWESWIGRFQFGEITGAIFDLQIGCYSINGFEWDRIPNGALSVRRARVFGYPGVQGVRDTRGSCWRFLGVIASLGLVCSFYCCVGCWWWTLKVLNLGGCWRAFNWKTAIYRCITQQDACFKSPGVSDT